MFTLHPQLQADTTLIKKLEVSQVLLARDSRYPWVILVPEVENAVELHLLETDTYRTVSDEIRFVADRLYQHFQPQKINIGALGNMVPQLHIHIVARWQTDEAWPGPIWGVGEAKPYPDQEIMAKTEDFRNILK
ncbi:MAG: HIT family protein [Sneathiella sp.]|nr:HIT family protein [Sneathiella sp.]